MDTSIHRLTYLTFKSNIHQVSAQTNYIYQGKKKKGSILSRLEPTAHKHKVLFPHLITFARYPESRESKILFKFSPSVRAAAEVNNSLNLTVLSWCLRRPWGHSVCTFIFHHLPCCPNLSPFSNLKCQYPLKQKKSRKKKTPAWAFCSSGACKDCALLDYSTRNLHLPIFVVRFFFFRPRALLTTSQKGSTLHQPAQKQTLHHRHKRTCLRKPGEETYLDIWAGSAAGSRLWHDSWGDGEEQQCSRWRGKKKIHRILKSNHFTNPTGAISEEQLVQTRLCNL